MFDNYHCITSERLAKFGSLGETASPCCGLVAKLGQAAPVTKRR